MKECQQCKTCYSDEVSTCPKDGLPTIHTIAGEPVLEGKYNLECRLGQGGMGVVYKARHAYLKTQLAIKIILPDLVGNDPQLVTRFRQEALAAAAIRHQNVVSVTDYGVIHGSIPFLVMEYVDGESLHDLLAREKKLSPDKALELMSAICAGVGAAHHQGIVHRDLKPLNIMICNDKPNMSQAVKILDFGLAKIKSGELLGSFIQAQTTGLMGSPYYMAPEQWADDEPDSRSDIYSLGVMLYQMLAGDVPFKGSSIPAIMKKHISDPAPTFAELGVQLSPEIEAAVRHTLNKEKEKRTPTVEVMINELRDAVYPPGLGIHTTSGGAYPVTSINIRTNPPHSKVFVDDLAVGHSREDGWITLNGVQSGSHRLRVIHEGFPEWQGDVICDGRPQQVLADLVTATAGPAAGVGVVPGIGHVTPHRMSSTQDTGIDALKTQVQSWDTGRQHVGVQSQPPQRSYLSPLVIGLAAFLVLFILAVAGLGGAWLAGIFGTKDRGNVANTATPTPTAAATPGEIKAEMVPIPSGSFMMGNNEGRDNERPEHEVSVDGFLMDRTEVTNAEYFAFISDTNYKPVPPYWENGRPLRGQERQPVRYVNMEDIKAFIAWRSKRDGANYRLPTEQEWEYAARNGGNNDIYPWGDKYDTKCAVLDKSVETPEEAGSKSCPNQWGVVDLIGNVFEWTSSQPSVYPGSPLAVEKLPKVHFMIRGGGASYSSSGPTAITSTFRQAIPFDMRSPGLGFRLVRSQ